MHKSGVTEIRCWWCGLEPVEVIEIVSADW
jgi:hypothetical protein